MAAPATTGTRTRTAPDLMGSPLAADALVAELLDHADHLRRDARRLGLTRIMAARERTVRMHAAQIAEVHGLDVDTDYREPEQPEHVEVEHRGGDQ